MIFLWTFLPIVLFLYYALFLVKKEQLKIVLQNILLLLASLFFYAWGEPVYIFLMLITITVNYVAGILMEKALAHKGWVLAGTIAANLGFLFYFKYFNLFVVTFNKIASSHPLELKEIALPIGISFYTFQAMSYVIDLYRGEIEVQKKWYKLALYISFFPQLIAGPIVKYRDICEQINARNCTQDKFVYGIKRFSYGLGKKVILANTFASVVDSILSEDELLLGTFTVWLAALCYTLQIYFDFSGYSDMAIGLGKMFGFDINENFNYPYISKSIQEFWRRWHISLSTWFKEYLYIPLGGNRKGKYRTYLNLFIVFFVTGLWHGAAYTFILWGLYHGFFSILERLFLGKALEKNPVKIINHIYTMLVVCIGWVLFRADNLHQAYNLIKQMFVYAPGNTSYVGVKEIILIILGVILSVAPALTAERKNNAAKRIGKADAPGRAESVNWGELIVCAGCLLYSGILLICDTYNPFIYFRF